MNQLSRSWQLPS